MERLADGNTVVTWSAQLAVPAICLELSIGKLKTLGYPVVVRVWPPGRFFQIQTLRFYAATLDEGRTEAEAVAELAIRGWPLFLARPPSQSVEGFERLLNVRD